MDDSPPHLLLFLYSSVAVAVAVLAGDIIVLPAADDAEKMDGLFSIELNTRIYILRAASDQDAAQWVSVLNKIKAEGGGSGPGSGRTLSRTNSAPSSPSQPPPAPQQQQQQQGGGSGFHSFDISAAAAGEGGAGAADKVRSPSDGNTDWLKSPRRRWQLCSCCS